ncbi:MAG: AtpZ/AtpI family protein [Hyphomicrobiales bacterium]|nr:AtpZ/AtpI family protein [Hyphomicrobiales bacterium]MCY4049782.1 AtpZ/AtpI family protein [Hyphomicrobiales bacterium]MCY4053127.1 AtpZ/AtpI family protein [Hyphomicrobiales bacterium]
MDKLQDLSHRLEQAQARRRGNDSQGDRVPPRQNAATGIAMRVGIELLVAVCVAGFFGWAMDEWLGTKPWMFLAFIPLGIIAGIMNVLRAAKTINTQQDGD